MTEMQSFIIIHLLIIHLIIMFLLLLLLETCEPASQRRDFLLADRRLPCLSEASALSNPPSDSPVERRDVDGGGTSRRSRYR